MEKMPESPPGAEGETNPIRNRPCLECIGIFLLALAVRLFYLWQYSHDPLSQMLLLDAEYYSLWARRIAAGDILGEGVFFVSPLYAYFLGTIYALLGTNPIWVYLVQFVMGSLGCVLLYLIGRKLSSPRVGAIAALGMCFYGYFIFMEGQALKTALSCFLAMAAFFLYLYAKEKDRPALWFALGAVLGLTALVIPNALVFVPVLLLAAAWGGAQGRKAIAASVFLAGVVIAVAPVTARNILIGGDTVLISSNGGFTFYLGSEPETEGGLKRTHTFATAPLIEEQSSRFIAERALGRELRPSDVSRYWAGRAIDVITGDITGYTALLFKKLHRIFNKTEIPVNLDFYYFRERYRLLGIPGFSYGVLVPLALLGAYLSRRKAQRLLPAYFYIAIFTLSLLPFQITGRYRAPLVPVLLILAASALVRLVDIKKIKPGELAVSLMILVAGAFAFNTQGGRAEPSWMHMVLGQAHAKGGRYQEALTELKEAVRLSPKSAEARASLGKVLYLLGDVDGAINSLKEATVLDHNNLDAHYALGLMYYEQGDDWSASSEFDDVIRLDAAGDRAAIVRSLMEK